jgi:hypothetical protein
MHASGRHRRRERDLTAARYARWAGEHKYDFNMQVSVRDMTRQKPLVGQKDVVLSTVSIFEYDKPGLGYLPRRGLSSDTKG